VQGGEDVINIEGVTYMSSRGEIKISLKEITWTQGQSTHSPTRTGVGVETLNLEFRPEGGDED
jgi:hypothetical protein